MTLKCREVADHGRYGSAKFELVHRKCEEVNRFIRAQSDKSEINAAGEIRKYQKILLLFIICASWEVNGLTPQFS